MFCKNCGAQIVDGERFCGNCGAPITQAAPAPQAPVYQAPAYQTPAYQTPAYQQPQFNQQGQPVYQYAEPAPEGTPGAKAHVTFGEAIKLFFKNYANFNGRSVPGEYWYWFLLNFIITFPLSIIASLTAAIMPVAAILVDVVLLPYEIAVMIPGLAVCVRRMHDTGRSGWAILISFVPVVGIIIGIIWLCQASDVNNNQYGPAPRQF